MSTASLVFPKVEIPNFQVDSQSPKWDPKLYQPMIHNERVKYLSETLRPGTLEYDDFWDEMDFYCLNGYKPVGMPRITGRHFYYLNFTKIDLMPPGSKSKKKILGTPFYRDLDHWLFLEIEAAQKYGYGLIIAKPRRVGLSEFGALNCNYEMTFFHRNKIGICAGQDDKAQEFYDKLKSSLENTHEAYKHGKITNNPKELKLGYINRVNKQDIESGILSIARIKTMYAKSSAFEGGSYSQVIFEEIGLFENLTASYASTLPCFMEGDMQFGVPLLYGTGGEVDKGAAGFKKMWDQSEAYRLKKIFVPAYYYYPGDGVPDEKTGETISFFDYKKGVTDRARAKKWILAKREIAAKAKETYIKHLQSYPLEPSEVFLKNKGGKLDTVKLQYQLRMIEDGKAPKPVLQGNLIWQDTREVIGMLARCKNLKEKTKVRVENNIKVKFQPSPNNDEGPVWIDDVPINPNSTHLPYKPDIGACDSYDEEVDEKKVGTEQVSSLCMMAYRVYSGPTRAYDKPIGLLYQRGDASFDDDEAYENAVKFAIYFDMEVLFEYTKFHIMRYFKDVGAHDYIKSRPDIDELGTKGHGNKDGIKVSPKVAIAMEKCLKEEVRENIYKCWFRIIIMDLMNYGEKNTDISMTLALCKIHQMDLFGEITDGIQFAYTPEPEQELPVGMGSYYLDFEGNLMIDHYDDESVQLKRFIPERDLDEKEYKEYVDHIQNKDKELKQEMTDHEKKAKELGVDASMLALIMNEAKRYGD